MVEALNRKPGATDVPTLGVSCISTTQAPFVRKTSDFKWFRVLGFIGFIGFKPFLNPFWLLDSSLAINLKPNHDP